MRHPCRARVLVDRDAEPGAVMRSTLPSTTVNLDPADAQVRSGVRPPAPFLATAAGSSIRSLAPSRMSSLPPPLAAVPLSANGAAEESQIRTMLHRISL
jgi:hypothetical protein